MNLYEKNLLFRTHPRSPVYAAAVSLVLIGYMRTTCRPKPCPSPLPTPHLSQVPDQGQQENRGGEGEELLLVISCLLCSDRILSRLRRYLWLRPPFHAVAKERKTSAKPKRYLEQIANEGKGH